MSRKWGYLLTTLIIGLALGVMAILPPSPQGQNTATDKFSSGRAMKDVRIIAAEPHATGTPENAKVRAYLMDRMTALSMEVTTTESMLGERALARLNGRSGTNKTEQVIINIIGVLPGEDRTKPAVLLMAHHDTVWGSPGAADDTIGIASIFETIRALNKDGTPGRDLIVLITDGEELGLNGAVHFFANNPMRKKVGAIINFEARGGGGTANMFQTSAENGDAIKLYADVVKQPSVSSLSTFVYSVLPNDTDLTPALEGDYVAYNIANIGRAKYYHSPAIDADALEEGSLQHMGSQALDLTRALLSADTLPAKKPDAVFFDLYGLFTIIYAPFWGWIFLVGAAVLYLRSAKLKERRDEILGGLARMLTFLLIGGGALYVLNAVSGGGSGANYYDRLAAIPKLEVLALFLCFGAFFALFGNLRFTENLRFGAVLPTFALGLAGQILAPTAAYFITLPLFLYAIAAFSVSRWPDSKISKCVAVLIGALIFGYMVFLGHLLMQGVGPDLLAVAILPAALTVLAIAPIWPGLPKASAKRFALTGLAIAVAMSLFIRFDPMASTIPLYSSDKGAQPTVTVP